MANATRFGDVPFIAETTVWGKLDYAPRDVQEDFRAAAQEGLVAGHPVVWLEFVFWAKNHEKFDETVARLSPLPSFPVTEAICAGAMAAVQKLREIGSPGNHRVKAPDALIAATAAANGFNVLHDDKHYDKLATVLDFESIRFGPYHKEPSPTETPGL